MKKQTGKCSAEGCERIDLRAKGLCRSHYIKSIANVIFADTVLCSVRKCKTKSYAKGLCRLHYKRKLAGIPAHGGKAKPCIVCGGATSSPRQKYCGSKCRMKWHREFGCYTDKRQLASRGACSIEGCGNPVHAKGMCRAHSIRVWRHGDPMVDNTQQFGSLTCVQCGESRQSGDGSANDLCPRCYQMDFYYKNRERDKPRRNARRTFLEKITPKWADRDAIVAFYAACPEGMEVDHIIPVGNKRANPKVCGLHTLDNLQYLTPKANKEKRNHFDESWHKPSC